MNEGKPAIICDVDECMVSTNGSVDSDFYMSAYQFAKWVQEANVGSFPSIRFCTGRDRNYVEAIAFAFGLPNALSIIEHGAIFFNPKKKLWILNPCLSNETLEKFRDLVGRRINKFLNDRNSLFLYPGNQVCFSIERKSERKRIDIKETYKLIRKEMVYVNKGGQRKIAEVTHSNCAVDIVPYGINKGTAIEALAEYDGLDLDRSLGIGDSKGDIPFLEKVKLTGCPSNASEVCTRFVKSKRGRVSHKQYIAGVVDIIEYFAIKTRM